VLTHGFTLLPNQSGIPDSFFQMANKIATVSGNTPENSGLIMRYDKPTGNWIPIDLQGRVITELTGGLETSEADYLSTLANNLKAGIVKDGKRIEYLNKNKPLVLLPEWSLDRESVIPDVGFSEGAADALFASMVQLDLALGGKVGEYEGNKLQRLYDSQGKLIRKQGDLFNSPLHFMGFSRGTVVNSEIVQRLGTFFPQAGGTSMANRDLQMTTIDPHDFYQPSLNLKLPGFISTNFSDFYEPKIQVWNNVTWADNYYQTVADPNSGTATPNGRALGLLPQEELNKNPQPAGLNFPTVKGDTLGQADREILLGTREGEPGREHSRIGFTKDDFVGGTHTRAFGWYAGTVDLSLEQVKVEYPHVEASEHPQEINDILSEKGNSELSDPNKRAAKDWYDNANGEGVNDGWFYSVLGGGKEQRKYSSTGRVPVSFDNTLSAGMRGDYAVPTLFNGNFDQFIPNKSQPETYGRNLISKEIPGWSLHNGATSTLVSPINNLVEWTQIAQQSPNFLNNLESLGINSQSPDYQPSYALKLGAGDSITHNRFVVPDWGVLRLDLHVPESSLNKGGRLKVYLEEVGSPENVKIGEISLEESEPTTEKATRTSLREREPDGSRKTYEVNIPGNYGYDKDTIGYGSSGFETFHIDVPPSLRGKVAKLTFELQGEEPVYIDNAFFKSEVLKWGNPTEARNDLQFENNFLIEKPQYTLSYNRSKNTINWVGWKLDKTWLGSITRTGSGVGGFAEDPDVRKTGWYAVQDSDYDALYLTDRTGQMVDNRQGTRYTDGFIDFETDDKGKYIPMLSIDRGHMTPAADRNRTLKDYYATYLTTNLLPQQSENNQGVWKNLEEKVRDVIDNSAESDSLATYSFAGGYGYYDNPVNRPYTGISQNSNLEPLIQFPLGLWKVVFTEENNAEQPTFAHYGVYIGNDARIGYQKTSVQEIENLLNNDLRDVSPKYQFLSKVPESPDKESIKNTPFERFL
jgi:DNA/RNA endonuclease G (NUC1)